MWCSRYRLQLATLHNDEGLRKALGARGRTFAEQSMSVTRSAKVVTALHGVQQANRSLYRAFPFVLKELRLL